VAVQRVHTDGDDIILEVRVNIREYVEQFGTSVREMGPQQRRWLKGKIQQEFSARLQEAFQEEDEKI
jgi:hypothetical protein